MNADFVALPTANLHEVPAAEVPDEAAVFTQPVAAACEIPEQMPIPPGVFPLDAGTEAFEYMNQTPCLKVLLAPDARRPR